MGAGQDLCPEAEVDVSHVCVDVLGRTRGLVCETKGRELGEKSRKYKYSTSSKHCVLRTDRRRVAARARGAKRGILRRALCSRSKGRAPDRG